YLLEQPGISGRTLAWTGAQQHHRGNPIIRSYGLDGKLNVGSMKIKSHHMDSDGVKALDTDFLRGASEGDRHALASLREIDEVRLANAANADHRMKFSTLDKMHVMNDIVTDNLLSNSVERNEFEAGTKGDADFQAERKKQRDKEQIIKRAYDFGQQRLEHPELPPGSQNPPRQSGP
ncbi:MAG: hypothetical protein U1D32_03320, partial [Patescibacteria group bacterium]|nr:hypothetical protein [Patescibacteria group bacterium]